MVNKKTYGCEKDIKPFPFFGEKLTRCPLRIALDDPDLLDDAANHYEWYDKGAFPSPGTWYEQGAVWVDAMRIIRTATAEAENAEQDRQARRKAAQDEVTSTAPPRAKRERKPRTETDGQQGA